MIRNGIDVSKYQGSIEWRNVKNVGIEFAILRAGIGKNEQDECFESNYHGCKEAGISCGAYWYSKAMSVEEAKQEAASCLSVLNKKQLEYPIFYDMEEEKQLALGKDVCSEIAAAFLETIEAAGYFTGIYGSKSHLETNISEAIRKRYTVWVAQYGVEKTSYSDNFGIWQKSDTGTISGINGYVDLDECCYDYPKVIKAKQLNNFGKPVVPTEPAEKSVSELAQEVLNGKWGNAPERRKRLEAAGYDYDAVQKLVNKLVSEETHTVVSGDTLSALALKYHTKVKTILDANISRYPTMTEDYIQVGWKLTV